MDKPQFTPGPWVASSLGYGLVLVPGERDAGGRPLVVADVRGQNEANARLIAAAPELYEALVAYEVGLPTASEWAKHALAKARGEQ